jgi:mono/diheme cytochrome c family protein
MKNFLLGLILGVVLVPAAFYFYIRSGRVPVATSDPMMPFERRLAKLAMHARVDKEQPNTVPIKADDAAYLAGARVYQDSCAMCHGLPNEPAPKVAKGMFPPPPQLFDVKHPKHNMVTDNSPGETFWQAKNGLRLSGMPAFQASLSDEQLWQVTLLVANADKLPSKVQQALSTTEAAAGNCAR